MPRGAQVLVVSIHTRLATGDFLDDNKSAFYTLFQFTPVLRRVTAGVLHGPPHVGVSIHTRLATGDRAALVWSRGPLVSIHTRLATGDIILAGGKNAVGGFNSHPSCDG